MGIGMPRELSPQERVIALVELLAEGLLFLSQEGVLNDDGTIAGAVPKDGDLSAGRKEGKVSHGP